ncbi:hypothetical protein J6590_034379 [Homalodisca vitripennis]|nr:hypothetical protein J6590_034379 [Homalodisca vitripennis]
MPYNSSKELGSVWVKRERTREPRAQGRHSDVTSVEVTTWTGWIITSRPDHLIVNTAPYKRNFLPSSKLARIAPFSD